MSETTELELEKVRQSLEDAEQRESNSMIRWIALSTAILATITAVVELQAGTSESEALVLKSEATMLQAQASDEWAYYQAKGIKGAVTVGRITAITVTGRPAPDSLNALVKRYAHEQDSLTAKARELEHERDAKNNEAGELIHRHQHFAGSVALLQVSIALGAVAALTRRKAAWWASMVAGAGGIVLAIVAALGG